MALRPNRNAFLTTPVRVWLLATLPPAPPPDPPIVLRIDALARAMAGDGPQSRPQGARASVDRALARAIGRSAGGLSLVGATTSLQVGASTTTLPVRPVNAGRAGALTPDPALAVLAGAGRAAIGRARQAAANLQRSSGPNAQEIAAIAGSVLDILDNLQAELDRPGGPREPHIDDLLQRLNVAPPPAPAFGLVNDINVLLTAVAGPPRFPPDLEGLDHTAFQVLLDATNELWNAWVAYQLAVAAPAPGSTQALAGNLHNAANILQIIGIRIEELRGALQSVHVRDADQDAFQLNAPAMAVGVPILHLAGLLQMIWDFAALRGPRLLDQGDQSGLGDVQDEATALFYWTDQLLFDIRLNVGGNQFAPLFDTRVDRPLFNLHNRLHDLASLL